MEALSGPDWATWQQNKLKIERKKKKKDKDRELKILGLVLNNGDKKKEKNMLNCTHI